jgi:anti-sigma regulatory factor (Ser/Thr protein kinase)
MLPDAIVAVHEKTDVAAARRAALDLAAWPEDKAGKLSIVVTEAATNLVKHAGGGQIVIRRAGDPSDPSHSCPSIEVIAIDKGPGLADPERCFEDGYSTAGSPGTGLGAISRIASFVDYYSAPGKGTVLVARLGGAGAAPVEIGAVGSPYPGEEVSGDSWSASQGDRGFRMIMADGLGHGMLAAEASDTVVSTARDSQNLAPEALLEKCHGKLRATRGAAVSLADADFASETLWFAGVGNVSCAIVNESGVRRQMVSSNGTVGHEMRRVHPYRYELPPGSTVVLHSDGLSTSWNLEKYPLLLRHHPSVVAAVLFRDFVRGRDDATVVVARAGSAGRPPA